MKDETVLMFKEVVAELNKELNDKYKTLGDKTGWFSERLLPKFELGVDEEEEYPIPSISYGPFHIHKHTHGYMVDEEVYQKWGVEVGSKQFEILHAKAIFNMLMDEMANLKFQE
jgi:hypothetical protein